MAFEDDVLDVSLIAGEDLRLMQYHFVKLSANSTAKVCTGATDTILGVLQNKPNSGEVARVRVYGISRIYVATSAIPYGSLVGTDTSGHGVVRPISVPGDKGVFFGICTDSTTTAAETNTMLCLGKRNVVTA
jgi:hypothetical protein